MNQTLETRLENVLNYFIETNNAVGYDYRAGGYVNYGLLPDGRFAIDLDGFSMKFVGTFSTTGSRVTSINIWDSFGGVTIYEGVFDYVGLPFFSAQRGDATLNSRPRFIHNPLILLD